MGARKASSRVVVAGTDEQGATAERPERPDTAEMTATPAAADGEVATAAPGTADMASMASMATMARVGYAPIVRVDAPRREIELCATSEAVDSHGTIFDYDASREAFTR